MISYNFILILSGAMITYGLPAVYEITRLAHQSVRAAKQRAPDPDGAGSGQLHPRGGCGRHRAVPQPHV